MYEKIKPTTAMEEVGQEQGRPIKLPAANSLEQEDCQQQRNDHHDRNADQQRQVVLDCLNKNVVTKYRLVISEPGK